MVQRAKDSMIVVWYWLSEHMVTVTKPVSSIGNGHRVLSHHVALTRNPQPSLSPFTPCAIPYALCAQRITNNAN
jgi:hypothetical protein